MRVGIQPQTAGGPSSIHNFTRQRHPLSRQPLRIWSLARPVLAQLLALSTIEPEPARQFS